MTATFLVPINVESDTDLPNWERQLGDDLESLGYEIAPPGVHHWTRPTEVLPIVPQPTNLTPQTPQ
jgi:hypothetical protein